jgi:Flp pilus assembly protein TadG
VSDTDPRDRGAQTGASAVEFALVVVLFVTLLFGVVEFGRAVWLHQAVAAASREGTRFGIGSQVNAAVPQYLDCDGIRDAARDKVPDLSLSDDQIVITHESAADGMSDYCDPDTNTPAPEIRDGDRITVEIEVEMDVNLPLVPLGPYTISASDTRSVFPGIAP